MKKVNLTTKEVTNEALPKFLKGLKQESLNDLSWTDEALGVQPYGWWIDRDVSTIDNKTQVFDGTESYTLDEPNFRVIVTRGVRDKTQEELDAEFQATVPRIITRVQAMKAMKQTGTLWDDFNALLASNVDAKDEWELSTELQRGHALTVSLGLALGLTEPQLDDLFILGDTL